MRRSAQKLPRLQTKSPTPKLYAPTFPPPVDVRKRRNKRNRPFTIVTIPQRQRSDAARAPNTRPARCAHGCSRPRSGTDTTQGATKRVVLFSPYPTRSALRDYGPFSPPEATSRINCTFRTYFTNQVLYFLRGRNQTVRYIRSINHDLVLLSAPFRAPPPQDKKSKIRRPGTRQNQATPASSRHRQCRSQPSSGSFNGPARRRTHDYPDRSHCSTITSLAHERNLPGKYRSHKKHEISHYSRTFHIAKNRPSARRLSHESSE